jgi:flagellar motor protein MotB
VADEARHWTHTIVNDPDGTYRVEITDEDNVVFPVARQVTRGQAERLVERIAREARELRQPVKVVIRDPYFMAATIITLKRQAI